MLSIDFTLATSPYGAAHPLSNDSTLTFWLDRGRILKSKDIFSDDTGWQTKLAPLINAKLHADTDIHDYILENEVAKGIQQLLDSRQEWSVMRDGIEFNFNHYQVTAYVAGEPSVFFSWSELAPYLNAGLHPETLPACHEKL
jgi:hypothetical protein